MAQAAYTCESCGVRVTPREVDEGGAFFDGEHCYCAICVARLMQKVRTAQRGGKVKTVGIVFQEGLTSTGPRVPAYLLYTIVAEAALAAIMLVILLVPSTVELPGSDEVVREETRIKALLAKADNALAAEGKAQEALSILRKADNFSAGTAWSHLVKERMEQASKLVGKEARGVFLELERRYKTFIEKNEFDLALAVLEQFPEKYRDTSYRKADIDRLRERARFYKEADKAYRGLLARAVPLRNTQKYDEALELLRLFPEKYAVTPAASLVAKKIDEISKQRERWAEMQRREQEQREAMTANIEKLRREEEERRQRAMEEKQRRLAAQEARRKEEENRKKREQDARAQEQPPPPPETPPKPGPEEETTPAAIKVKGEWEEVRLTPGSQKEFPFFTPRPKFVPLERGAMGEMLFVPYPHKGKISGFGVSEREKAILVDTDADGKPDKQLPAEGGVVTLKLSFEEGKEIPCAVEIGREGGRLAYRRGGWVAGRFKGTNIAIIDENSNCKYNEVKEDAIVVGSTKGAAVLGDLVGIKDEFYQIEVQEDGSKLRLRPVELSTGKLSLAKSFKGKGKLRYVVVYGVSTEGEAVVSFELSGQRKPVSVPAGKYFIFAGEVQGPDRAGIRIHGGPKAKDFKVEPDKTAAPKWGAPGVVEFKYTLNLDGTLEVSSNDIRLYGALGEEYYGWGPKQWMPRVQVKDSSGKTLVDRPFRPTPELDDYYRFEELVPINKKLKVRIVGEPQFLGPCASEWK